MRLAQQVEHTPKTYRPEAGPAINFEGIPLPLCVLHSLPVSKTRKPTGRQKRAKKKLFSGFWGKKSLMCWFLSPNHSLKK